MEGLSKTPSLPSLNQDLQSYSQPGGETRPTFVSDVRLARGRGRGRTAKLCLTFLECSIILVILHEPARPLATILSRSLKSNCQRQNYETCENLRECGLFG